MSAGPGATAGPGVPEEPAAKSGAGSGRRRQEAGAGYPWTAAWARAASGRTLSHRLARWRRTARSRTAMEASHLPLSSLAVAAPLAIMLAGLVGQLGLALPDWGDSAVIELQVRRALRWQALVGPYSRFGWHHPGPALFYALAPVYALGGEGTWSLSLGCFLVNAIAAVASVLAVRRFAGERAARWAGAMVAAYLLVLSPGVLVGIWNPDVLSLPLLLTAVLAAAGAAGSAPALAWALVSGTFVAQTDVSTVPVVLLVLAVGFAGWGLGGLWLQRWAGGTPRQGRRRARGRGALRPDRFVPGERMVGRRRDSLRLPTLAGDGEARVEGVGPRWRSWLLAAGGLGVTLALWAPPVYQQLASRQGNLGRLISFFTARSHAGLASRHPLGQALAAVVGQLSAVPLGSAGTSAVAPAHVSALRLAVGAVWFADSLAVLAVGVLLRRRMPAALGFLSAAGMVLGVYSATRVVGPEYGYLVAWMSVLPVPAWIGTGVVVRTWWLRQAGRRGSPGRPPRAVAWCASGLLVVALALPAGVLGWRLSSVPPMAGPRSVPALTAAVTGRLRALGARRILVRIPTHARWPVAAGMVVDLAKDGYQVTVSRQWEVLFGSWDGPTGRETAAVVVAGPPGPAPPAGVKAFTARGSLGTTTAWVVPLRG